MTRNIGPLRDLSFSIILKDLTGIPDPLAPGLEI
jgi:hypothetical protein